MSRKRKHISFPEKLAATLACLLTQEHRDDLRGRKVPASEVLSLFHFDHIHLHAFEGSDFWWNLDPMLAQEHKEKSKTDTSIVAKAKRIDNKQREWMARFASKYMNAPNPSTTKFKKKWPSRKFGNKQKGK